MAHRIVKHVFLYALISCISIPSVWSQNNLKFIDKTVSRGMRTANNRTISVVIIHSTFNNSGGEKYDIDLIIKQFSRYGVSSHYVIGRDGSIYCLVKEKNIAFHAGKSELPNGKKFLNACSIGIELMTSYDETPTEEQLKTATLLIQDIKKRHPITNILRHSDIAPDRKTDPWNMNWEEFLKGL